MNVVLFVEGEMKGELKEGKLVITYGGKGASVQANIEMGYLLDKIEEAIPGDQTMAAKALKQLLGAN